MKELKKYMSIATIFVVFIVVIYKLIAISFDNGIYEYPIMGAVFEMTWIPLLLCLATLPVLWLVYLVRKEIEFKKGVSYLGVCVMCIMGVLFL